MSYNNIETIPEIISMNSKLKIIHLAYNDLKEIGDIMSLTQLAHLSILSLFGNPFLALLNYITFLKMILPSLMIIDDRDANECVVSGEVYPQD